MLKAVVPCLLAAALTVTAPHAPSVVQDTPTVAELIAAHAEARGGRERWEALASLRRTTTSDVVTTTAIWAGVDRARVESYAPEYNVSEVRVVNGRSGWLSSSVNGKRALTDREMQMVREEAAWGWELLAPKALGVTATLAGRDDTGGVPSWKLDVTIKSGNTMSIYLHRETHLEVGRALVAVAPDGSTHNIWHGLGNHGEVSGLGFPRALNQSVITLEVNIPVTDKMFARPAL